MTLRELQYLIELANHRNFRKAADACFVSQPALSMQIKKLEKYLGTKLIERSQKSVLLTPVGELVVTKSRDILKQVIELKNTVKLLNDPFTGEVKLGIIPTLAPYLLPIIIPALSKKYPNLTIYLAEEQTGCLIEKLKAGEFDAIILSSPISESGYTTKQLFEEEFMLAVPKTHTLAKRDRIAQHEIQNTPLLALEDEHCMWEQSLAFNPMNDDKPKFRSFRATSLETLRHMVGTGVGMTLIPRLACDDNPCVAYIPFCKPKPKRSVGIMWRDSAVNIYLLQTLTDFVKRAVRKSQKF